MNVRRLCWLGIATTEPDATIRLFRDVMGLAVEIDEATTTELSLPSGDRVQVFGPGSRSFEFFGEHASGPVALFEVDDVSDASGELAAAGIEIVGEIHSDGAWAWLNFRGPDGNLYELASRQR